MENLIDYIKSKNIRPLLFDLSDNNFKKNDKNISITNDGKLLNKLNKGETLKKDSWFLKDKRIYLCFDLSYENVIKIERRK